MPKFSPNNLLYLGAGYITSYFLPAVAQLQQEIERIKKDKEALNSAISSVNSVKTPKTGAR